VEPQAHKTERTRATVLFADLVGFTALSQSMGTEQAYLVATGGLRILDEVARAHGGSVDKYLGDCLMAVFGHPVPSDDHAGAAVDAALEMLERLNDYVAELRVDPPLEVHIGLNSGSLVAGDIRGPVIREFHVLGDAVNVAARLKQRSPLGSIYVGPETYAATRERCRYRTLEPMALKGKSQPIQTYELLGASRRSARDLAADGRARPPLVGREEETRALEQALADLARGHGGAVSLEGQDGIGKSRLLAELAQSEAAQEIALIQAHAPAHGGGGDRQIVVDLLRGWVGIGDDEETDAVARVEAAVRSLLGEEASDLLPQLVELVAQPDSSGRSGGFPSRREALASVPEAARRLLERATEQGPLALVVEDLERADAASLELLAELLPLCASRPLLLLLAARSFAEGALARLRDDARGELGERARELHLDPLPPEYARRLVDAMASQLELSEETKALIEERAAGNPQRLVMGVFLAPALQSESQRASKDRSRETERRRATVLFADITGFTRLTETIGDERAYSVVADALQILDSVARKHGGTVDKYLGDCVLALFGVPEALEDAPRAAVNAAIEMRQRIHAFNRERQLEHPLDVHSGINTGLGISGDISGPMIREFAVMGEPVSVADKLADQAPAGQIYIGHEAQRFTKDVFEFEPVEPLQLPGGEEPLPVFEVRSTQPQLYRRRSDATREIFSQMVGRAAEMLALRECIGRLARGVGGIVSVIGEAGLGKSRLMDELRASPEAEGLRWLEGRSLSIGQQLSFHPFGDLLRTWAAITDEDEEEKLPSRVEEATLELFDAESDELAPLLATLMGIRLPARMQERIDAIPDEMMERVLHASFTRFLQRLSQEQPLVLVFDDLHWADGSSIELLESLLRLTADHAILFVHVFRAGFAETSDRILELARTEHGQRHRELALEPLDEEAARELVNNLFRQAAIPHRVRTLIVERAQGNPFYFEEVVRSLVEEGAVEPVSGGFRATQKIHDVVIPGTVQEVIMARVDRLAPVAKQMLQVASVIGRSFHYEVLLHLYPDKDETQLTLDGLVEAQFVVPWDRLQGEEYAFKHPLIQEVTYDSLIRTKREELHLRAGDAIQAVLTENVPGYHAMLAYHFSLGRDAERAEESLFRAGDEAARSAASNEALHFFQQASQLYFELHGEGGDPRKKATLERNVGLATCNRGLVEDAIAHFDSALGYLGESVTKNPMRLNLRFARDMVAILAGLYSPLPARRRPAATADQREIINMMYRRAEAQTTADPMRFVFDAMAGLRKLSKADPQTVPEAGEILRQAVGIFAYSGISFSLSRRFLGLARELVGGESRAELPLWYRFVSWLHYFLEGDWSPAHEIDEPMLQEGLRDGHLFDVTTYLGLSADQALRKGEFAKARAKMEMNDKIWELYQYEPAKITHYAAPFMLGLEERRLPETIKACDVYNQESPQELLHLFSLGYKASAQLLEGAREEAEISLGRAAEIVKEVGSPIPYHLSGYRVARLHADVNDLEAACGCGDRREQKRLLKKSRASARAALRIVPKVSYRGPEVLRLVGRRAWLAGRPAEAVRHWERSLNAARALGMRPELARTHHEVGLRLAESSDSPRGLDDRDPAACREAARGLYAELGLDWDATRLETSDPP
jgi:class 3 adenylate cyclase